MKQKIKKQRYTVPDIIRGVAVIAMIIYHALWDIVYIFNVDVPWFESDAGFIFQQSILWTFVLVSGFCVRLGKRTLRRAITVLVGSLIITVVTLIFMPDSIIINGVLSFIGFAMLVTIPIDKILQKVPCILGIVAALIFFVLTYNVQYGFIGIGDKVLLNLPEFLYRNNITAFFGFPHKAFYSADYVPFIPWIFLFITGYFLFGILEKKNKLQFLSAVSCRPLEFIGRHSFEIYMVHQPLIYAVLMLVFAD
jgi:uncharacterized membrane protein